jgi:hypothetical protein
VLLLMLLQEHTDSAAAVLEYSWDREKKSIVK